MFLHVLDMCYYYYRNQSVCLPACLPVCLSVCLTSEAEPCFIAYASLKHIGPSAPASYVCDHTRASSQQTGSQVDKGHLDTSTLKTGTALLSTV